MSSLVAELNNIRSFCIIFYSSGFIRKFQGNNDKTETKLKKITVFVSNLSTFERVKALSTCK